METPKIIALLALICVMFSTMTVNVRGQTDTMHKKIMTPPDMIGNPDPHMKVVPPKQDTPKHRANHKVLRPEKRQSPDTNKKLMNPSNKFEKP